MKKWIANRIDKNGYVITGYEQVLVGSREEVLKDYIYWLELELNHKINPEEVNLVEVDWED